MPLSPQQKTYLKYLGDQGDAEARGIYESIQCGAERIVVLADNVIASAAANIVGSTGDDAAAVLPLTAVGGTAQHALVPRNVYATFGASWVATGDLVVVGTDQFDNAITETLAVNAGGTTVGSKAFKTITSITRQGAAGAGGAGHTVTVGSGSKLAAGSVQLHNGFMTIIVDGTTHEGPSAYDLTYSTFTPTTAPNGAHDYQLLCRAVI